MLELFVRGFPGTHGKTNAAHVKAWLSRMLHNIPAILIKLNNLQLGYIFVQVVDVAAAEEVYLALNQAHYKYQDQLGRPYTSIIKVDWSNLTMSAFAEAGFSGREDFPQCTEQQDGSWSCPEWKADWDPYKTPADIATRDWEDGCS